MSNKTITSILIIILIGAVAYFGYHYFIPKPKPVPGMGGLEQILKHRKLHLIEYKYNYHFFVKNKVSKKSKLALIIKLPVSVSALVDLEKIEIKNGIIRIPEPEIDRVDIDLVSDEGREIIQIKDGFLVKIKNSKSNLFDSFFKTIGSEAKKIENDAIKKGILDKAKKEAESFVNDLQSYFDKENKYKLEFFTKPGVISIDSIKISPKAMLDSIKLKSEKTFEKTLGLPSNKEELEWNYIEVKQSELDNLFKALDQGKLK